MLTAEQLRKVVMLERGNGQIVASWDGGKTWQVVIHAGCCAPEFKNVVASAIMLFNGISNAIATLEAAANIADIKGDDLLSIKLNDVEVSLRNTLDIAEHGIAYHESRKERK